MGKNLKQGLVACVACFTISLAAQGPMGAPFTGAGRQGGPSMPPTGSLQVHSLTSNVYWVEGGVGNVGFVVGDKGVVVIDTTISLKSAKELLADIATVTPKPVTTVILTHGDIDHVGGLQAFPSGISVIAQDGNRRRMQTRVASGRNPVPAAYLPNLVVGEREAVVFEGVKFELLHWAPAHTDGDLVVYLPAEKIVFTGDIFALDQPRALIHREQGGTSAGWITTASGIVDLDAGSFVIGHGAVQSKKELKERIHLVVSERDQIRSLVLEGKSLGEIQAAVQEPLPTQTKPGPGGPHFTPFSEVVYQEIKEQK